MAYKINYEKREFPLHAVLSCADLFSMQLHEIIEVQHEPYFRIMRVFGGWMYNFYDGKKGEYFGEWIHVHENDVMIPLSPKIGDDKNKR